MFPDLVMLVIYLGLFVITVFYTYDDGSEKARKTQRVKKKNDDLDDDVYEHQGRITGDAINTGHFTGVFGAIARKFRGNIQQQNLHYAAQIRSHPKHKEAKAELKEQLRAQYREYLRKGGE